MHPYDFLTDRRSSLFGVSAPGGREALQKEPGVLFKGPRGPLKGTRGPLKGPRGPLKGPRDPFKGPRGPLNGPRGPLKGPRGPVNGSWCPLKGSRDPLKGPRGSFKGPQDPLREARDPLKRLEQRLCRNRATTAGASWVSPPGETHSSENAACHLAIGEVLRPLGSQLPKKELVNCVTTCESTAMTQLFEAPCPTMRSNNSSMLGVLDALGAAWQN